VLHRVQTLALFYRLEGNPRYAERAWTELDAAARFKDWNPRHFLDTAEMTHAFAVGYDWLFDFWTPNQRSTLRTALVEKGLKLALEIHRKSSSWSRARHNWNQVCNGGIGMGALALADVEPELAGELLAHVLKSIQLAMAEYGPDGAWAEGPGYWNYATSYNVVFLAALESALGTDFNLSTIPGFSEAGSFPIYATGPLQQTFNYADARAGTIRSPSLFWLARKFDRPAYALYQAAAAEPHPLDLIWFHDAAAPAQPPPLDCYFRNAEVVTLRSAWNDKEAVFVGFIAGDNKANHSNLDLGTFVLDALGYRWAEDLGPDDYNLPGYFGDKRWTYYRLRAEGHNTLVLNPGPSPDQDPKAATKIVRFESSPARAFAVADLSAAYAPRAQRVWRGVALLDRSEVLIQDEIQSSADADLWWFLHTPAEVAVDSSGRTATLTQGKARLQARILAPSQARFTVRDAAPLPASAHPPKQTANPRTRKLALQLAGAPDLRLAVLLTPLRAGEAARSEAPKPVPLEAWAGRDPLVSTPARE
jgi:hypothetical protein